MAINVCQELELEGDLLDGCIFDIAVTEDTSFAEQETFKTGKTYHRHQL